jgi:hypothetical protein
VKVAATEAVTLGFLSLHNHVLIGDFIGNACMGSCNMLPVASGVMIRQAVRLMVCLQFWERITVVFVEMLMKFERD